MASPKKSVPESDLVRICHLADVHLGYRRYAKVTKSGLNQREVDVNLAFQEAINRIISLRPTATVIAGDLFHSVRPSNTIVTFCFRQLRHLARETKAPVILIAGNHETPKRVDTGSVLRLFGEIDGVYVADSKMETFVFPERDLAVTCLPHPVLLDRETLQLRSNDSVTCNVLVAHAQVNEPWVSDFGGVEIDLRTLAPHEWDYIALGHVHFQRTVDANAAYSGALEHTAANIWGEAQNLKGFLEVALPSGKRTFHPLTSPREIVLLPTIEASNLDPSQLTQSIVAAIETVPGGIEGKIVRLELKNVSRDSYRNLDHRAIRALRSQALNLTLDLSFAAVGRARDGLEHIARTGLRKEILRFAQESAVPGISRDEIAATLESYITKVEARHEAP